MNAKNLLIWNLAWSAAAGCNNRTGDRPFVVRDSSGVTIVESIAPAWDNESQWRLSDEPLLDLGGEGNDDAREFDRVAGALLLDDGSVAVADGGSSEIRMFDPSGSFRWRMGRPGDGPGEFRMMDGVGLAGRDSLWVYDFSLRRFTFVDRLGRLARVVTLQADVPRLGAVGRLSDGTLVLAQYWGTAVSESRMFGLRRDPVAYVRFSADGALIDTLGTFPGRDVYLSSQGGRMTMGSPPFGKVSTNALGNDLIFIGDQTEFVIGVYAANGSPTKQIRKQQQPTSIREEELSEWIDRTLETVPETRRPGLRRDLSEMDVPATRPAYQHLLTDTEGNLWVSSYEQPPEAPDHWAIFAPDGGLLGTLRMPLRFRPYSLTDTKIVGVWRDDLNVEHIRVYRIEKPDGDTIEAR